MLSPIDKDFGLPSKFTHWRELDTDIDQFDIAYEIAAATTRYQLLGAPPGSGKTVINIAYTLMEEPNTRVLYLVSTNQLLRQVQRDFESIGIAPIMGMANYVCNDANDSIARGTTMCNDGKCLNGHRCVLRQNGCDYFDKVAIASDSRLVLSNFAYAASIAKYSDYPIGKFDVVICDEAHLLLAWMSEFCALKLDRREYKKLGVLLPDDIDLEQWVTWAQNNIVDIAEQVQNVSNSKSAKRRRELRALADDVSTLANIDDLWVVEPWRHGVTLTPVEPGQFLDRYVFLNARKVVLCSASITKSDAPSFNCGDDFTYHQGGDGFKPTNRPLISIPTCKVSYNMPRARTAMWMLQIDSLCDLGTDYRGIIQTVSYPRMHDIYNASRHKSTMIIHKGGGKYGGSLPNINQALEQFYATPPPVILVSPVVGTGYDFKYDAARWQILVKMHFLNYKSSLVKARMKLWKSKYKLDYLTVMAAKTTMQAYGRITRADDDWGVTFVIDDAWGNYVSKNEVVPQWVKDAMSTCWKGLPGRVEAPS